MVSLGKPNKENVHCHLGAMAHALGTESAVCGAQTGPVVFTTDGLFVSGFGLALAWPVVLPTPLLSGDFSLQPYSVVGIQFCSAGVLAPLFTGGLTGHIIPNSTTSPG